MEEERVIPALGTAAPDFELPDQWGAPVRLSGFRGVRPVVLVFVPFAFSRTCTGELGELRDHAALFDRADAALLIASVDSKYALRAWAEAEGYGFRLLSDFWPHGAVAEAYGAFSADSGFATRSTFAIDRAGVIRSHFATGPGEARPLSAYRDALATL
jgi:peroxiredoxin